VESEYTLHNFSLFVISPPKNVQTGGNLTKFYKNKFAQFSADRILKVALMLQYNYCVRRDPNSLIAHYLENGWK